MKKYPKAFEKYYAKHHAALTSGRSKLDGHIVELLKSFAFSAWSAAAKKVNGRMKYIRKCTDGHYQHEDFDYLQEWVQELYKE